MDTADSKNGEHSERKNSPGFCFSTLKSLSGSKQALIKSVKSESPNSVTQCFDLAAWKRKRRIEEQEATMRNFAVNPMARLLVLTFLCLVTMESAKARSRQFLRVHLAKLILEYIRVMEVGKRGKPHANLLVEISCEEMINLLRSAIRKYGRAFGIGNFYFQPIITPGGIANYLAKDICHPHEGHAFSCSSGVTRYRYESDPEIWPRGVELFKAEQGCATIDELIAKHGVDWSQKNAYRINFLGKQNQPIVTNI